MQAIDPAGNVDPTPQSHTWTIETQPGAPAPIEISLDSGPASPTQSTSAQSTFSTGVPDARFECALDAAAFTVCTSPVDYADLAVGDHTFDVATVCLGCRLRTRITRENVRFSRVTSRGSRQQPIPAVSLDPDRTTRFFT